MTSHEQIKAANIGDILPPDTLIVSIAENRVVIPVWNDGSTPVAASNIMGAIGDTKECRCFERVENGWKLTQILPGSWTNWIGKCGKANSNPLPYVTDGLCERRAGHEGPCVFRSAT